jgi:hypothetical protein
MAVRYYGANKGAQGPVDVATGASTTSRAIELAVDDTTLPAAAADKKLFIATAVEAILQKLEQDAI